MSGTDVMRRPRRQGSGRPAPVLPFFVVTFAWSWTMWGAAAATGRPVTEPVVSLLYLLGVLGPLAGVAWVVRRKDRAYRRDLLRRVWDLRRISTRWWLALVAVAVGPAAVGAAVAWVAGVAVTVPDYHVGAVGAVVVMALVASLAEEPGWRGAAADAWQARVRPVWAGFGIGALWALWHLPLNLVEGTYYHGLDLGSVRFWLTLLMLVQVGVLYLWLANGSGGSILIAVLAHAGVNVAGELVPGSTVRDVTAAVAITAATLIVIAATKGRLGLATAGAHGRQPARPA